MLRRSSPERMKASAQRVRKKLATSACAGGGSCSCALAQGDILRRGYLYKVVDVSGFFLKLMFRFLDALEMLDELSRLSAQQSGAQGSEIRSLGVWIRQTTSFPST